MKIVLCVAPHFTTCQSEHHPPDMRGLEEALGQTESLSPRSELFYTFCLAFADLPILAQGNQHLSTTFNSTAGR
ncbi:hypothetical protein HQ563_09655 [bacterium]|nr:hypothetical protein [bacterium]